MTKVHIIQPLRFNIRPDLPPHLYEPGIHEASTALAAWLEKNPDYGSVVDESEKPELVGVPGSIGFYTWPGAEKPVHGRDKAQAALDEWWASKPGATEIPPPARPPQHMDPGSTE